jgi:hypothetical protein
MKILIVLHWVAFAAFTWIFAYAGLYKVLKVPGMMEGMASMGFHETWTLAIGWAEVAGAAGLLASLFYPPLRSVDRSSFPPAHFLLKKAIPGYLG